MSAYFLTIVGGVSTQPIQSCGIKTGLAKDILSKVPAVLPCLVFQMSGMINFSLLREYLFTEPTMDQFQFRLGTLRANVGVGSVELSLTKPWFDEYQILARYHTNTPC